MPVGINQKQYVELARDIAIRFNNKYGNTFVVPEPVMPKEGAKIMYLIDPTKKMSKSSENQNGVIRLLDEKDIIRKKIMRATTDSETTIKYNLENKPGISNLITIYSVITNKTISEVEEEFKDLTTETLKNVLQMKLLNISLKFKKNIMNF